MLSYKVLKKISARFHFTTNKMKSRKNLWTYRNIANINIDDQIINIFKLLVFI